MDWFIVIAVAVGAWTMLLVLSSERISQSQRLAVALAHAATVAAKKSENEIPIALSAEASLVGSPAAFNRKK